MKSINIKVRSLLVCASFCLLATVTPVNAGSATCTVVPKRQPVFNNKGKVVGIVNAKANFKIHQNVSKNGCSIAKYKIKLSKGYRIVYQLQGTNIYIDISSCKGLSQTC
ncbi:hypothetical protein [Crenothrix sp.]|uniref:hypothetical protein n=1 Tax=Crenothrix sp. TaxID=3100433 RepID=UPI00374D6A1B